jgi:hypothetical protein
MSGPKMQVKTYHGNAAFKSDAKRMYRAGWHIDGQSTRKAVWNPVTGLFTNTAISTVTWVKDGQATSESGRGPVELGLYAIGRAIATSRSKKKAGVTWVKDGQAASESRRGPVELGLYAIGRAIATSRSKKKAGSPPDATSVPPQGVTPAGWFADPMGRHECRYWDGVNWTAHVTDAGVPSSDPI